MAEMGEDTAEYKQYKKNFYEKGSQNISGTVYHII
jgi:hypothetical protein